MEEFYNSSVIIWTSSFHQVSIFIFPFYRFPFIQHPPEDSGCENLYLGGCHVQWIVLALSFFFLLFLTIRTVYISGENFTNDVYSWLQTLNQH